MFTWMQIGCSGAIYYRGDSVRSSFSLNSGYKSRHQKALSIIHLTAEDFNLKFKKNTNISQMLKT